MRVGETCVRITFSFFFLLDLIFCAKNKLPCLKAVSHHWEATYATLHHCTNQFSRHEFSVLVTEQWKRRIWTNLKIRATIGGLNIIFFLLV